MANGTLKVSNIETSSGSGTITLGQSGETLSVPSGVTLDMSSGTMTLNSDMKNTPSFLAYRSSSQTISQNTQTKIAFNTEKYDTTAVYDASTNYRFTPGVAGKYFIYTQVGSYGGSRPYKIVLSIYKNGSLFVQEARETDLTTNWTSGFARQQSVSVVDIADTDDYYEVFLLERLVSSGDVTIDYNANDPYTHFGAYRIIGA
jgi:hypothetical protein